MSEIRPSNVYKWYAVYTLSRWEKKVSDRLVENGIEVFLPIVKKLRQWSDRKKWVELPLLPSYIFVKVSEREKWDVLKVNGACAYVKFEGVPASIPDDQIETLKLLCKQNAEIKVSYSKIKAGHKVKIVGGALTGCVGIVKNVRKKKYFEIGLDNLDVSFKIEISGENLEIINS